jgi:hypothetical protein
MVDIIEIAKSLTRLNQFGKTKNPQVLCLARGKLVSNQCETNFGAKCLGFLKCRKNQAERRRAIDFLFFVGWSEPREGLGTLSFLSLSRTRLHQSPAVVRSRTRR